MSHKGVRELSAEHRATVASGLVLAFPAKLRATKDADVQVASALVRLLRLNTASGDLNLSVATARQRVKAIRDRNGVVALGRSAGSVLPDDAQREQLVREMFAIANSDGVYTTGEVNVIHGFAEGLGITSARWDALESEAISRNILSSTITGRLDAVRALLDSGASIDSRDPDGWCILHIAVARGHADIVGLLLARGPDLEVRNPGGYSALQIASVKPNEAIVEHLLRAGADPNARAPGGPTPLVLACERGTPGIVRVLRRAGARLDSVDELGRTPLHLAAARGLSDIVTFLVSEGAPVDARDALGRTPLHDACASDDAASVIALLDGHAPLEAVDHRGGTPLHTAAGNSPFALRVLLARGANLDARMARDTTPLHHAATHAFLTCARLLLDAGATVDARLDTGETPLICAAMLDHKEACDLLRARGADPGARNKFGQSATSALGSKCLPTRTTPLVDSPAGNAPTPSTNDDVDAIDRALVARPISQEAARLLAACEDLQAARWVAREGYDMIVVAGTDARGRPQYMTRGCGDGKPWYRSVVLAGPERLRWLPVFTTEAAAQAFRACTHLLWAERGMGLAEAVVHSVDASVFRLGDAAVDAVILNPYGPGPRRILSREECDRIARLLPRS